jgi:hypothetical protein
MEWKKSNNIKMEVVIDAGSRFLFELGSKVLSFLVQLEFVKYTVETLSKTEKEATIVPGYKIQEL